jgi:hypothetical protein
VRASHPKYGVRSARVLVRAGRRTTWTATLGTP